MIGRIIKIFSDFYYVETDKGLIEAKLRTVLKKQKADVYTGDFVELEQIDLNSMQAFISKVVKRKNLITRPKAANITQVIIVSALKEPDLNFEQLDRYIAHSEYHNIKPILCFNKEDIEVFLNTLEIEENTQEIEKIINRLYNKYMNKYDLYTTKNKIRQYLYSKGYTSIDIDEYIKRT